MARPAQGTETHRRGGAEDGRVRRYGGAGEAPDLRQGGGAAARVRVVRGGAVDSGGGHLHPQDSQCGAARGGGRALHPRGAGHGAAPRERGGWGAGGSGAGGGYALVGDGRGAGRVMSAGAQAPADLLVAKAQDRSALIGIVGLGYVGLPLAMEFARAGFQVLGFDVSQAVVDSLTQGRSHVQDVPSADVARFTKEGKFTATTDLARLREPDVVSICVPTPLSKTKDPDVSYVLAATNAVKQALRRGQLIVLESTTYPGTTRELMLPALEETGLQVGEDFFLAFSPERVDPGNPKWNTHNTPKVVGGLTAACRRVAIAVYEPGRAARGSKVLVVGVAYKKDIDDIRESPALDVIRLLQRRGAAVSYHDPHVRKLRDEAIDLASVSLTPETVSTADCVVIVTDHSDVDYALVERCARLVVDTRNALATVRQRRQAR